MHDRPRGFRDIFARIFNRAPHGAGGFGESSPPPDDAPTTEALEGWRLPNGDVTQARWKGNAAAVWWPLKDQVLTMAIKRAGPEFVLCIQGEAMYEFFTPALEEFVSLEALKAHQKAGKSELLHVEIENYHIRHAELRAGT